MMLALTMLRCPDGVTPETRQLASGTLSIGRSPEADWALPDAERVLSKRHCVVALQSGQWQVTDTSTNGTFINHEVAPLGPNTRRALRDGDRLVFGAYEIEVALGGGEAAHAAAPPADFATFSGTSSETYSGTEPDWPASAPAESGLGIALRLTGGLGPEPAPLPAPGIRPDQVPDIEEYFRAPRARDVLPADWDHGTGLGRSMSGAPAPDIAAPPPDAPPAGRAGSDRAGSGRAGSGRAATVMPEPAPEATQPAVPGAASGLEHGREPGPELGEKIGAAQGLVAFLAGAGVAAAMPKDAAATLTALGAAFRDVVGGLRRMMMARAAIKDEFRIGQTVIRPVGNNPLKFSADDEDALLALLGVGRRGAMPAGQALAEALRDMRLHELATATAMQQAVRSLLAELDPDAVLRGLPADPLDRLPGRRDRRAWAAWRALHARTGRALADDFDSVFGKAFTRAYERAMAELSAGESG